MDKGKLDRKLSMTTNTDELEQFSVYQFLANGFSEPVRRYVSAQRAVEAFQKCICSVSAKRGTTVRVIITDGDDCVCAEWQFGKGRIIGTKKAPAGAEGGRNQWPSD